MPRPVPRGARSLATGLLLLLASGCGVADASDAPAEPAAASTAAAGPTVSARPSEPSTDEPAPSSTSATATPTAPSPRQPARPEPRRSWLSIPELGMRDFPVVRYPGSPDDGPGTAIQNRGPMASPRGSSGGVGPGEVGNFIVTGHRLSHSAPLRDLPELTRGDRVRVRSGDTVHVYEIRRTRWTSFRSKASLRAQSAPVPGRPGTEPTRAMITLSTCATPEDHAAGNYWSDEFGNPEHRIDKIGVLVRTFRR